MDFNFLDFDIREGFIDPIDHEHRDPTVQVQYNNIQLTVAGSDLALTFLTYWKYLFLYSLRFM
jgi:hypothetical protein